MDTAWRATLDKHYAALSADLSAAFEIKLESEIARSCESLNQAIRRLRQAPAEAQTFQLVVEVSAPWADHLVVVMVESGQSTGAALNACAESQDPVSLLASSAEIGQELTTAIGEGSKVWLFPVVVRSKTAAILVAHGKVSAPAVELLSEVAGMR